VSVRVWISPPIFVAERQRYESTAQQYCSQFANFFPSKADGTPASAWVLTIGRSTDWTAAEADSELSDLFGGDLPSGINSPSDLKTLLRTRTISDVPLARRNAITAVLDEYGVPRADFTGATPLWKVFQRVSSTLFEKDANFASGFNF
jgi:hypothetical protein